MDNDRWMRASNESTEKLKFKKEENSTMKTTSILTGFVIVLAAVMAIVPASQAAYLTEDYESLSGVSDGDYIYNSGDISSGQAQAYYSQGKIDGSDDTYFNYYGRVTDDGTNQRSNWYQTLDSSIDVSNPQTIQVTHDYGRNTSLIGNKTQKWGLMLNDNNGNEVFSMMFNTYEPRWRMNISGNDIIFSDWSFASGSDRETVYNNVFDSGATVSTWDWYIDVADPATGDVTFTLDINGTEMWSYDVSGDVSSFNPTIEEIGFGYQYYTAGSDVEQIGVDNLTVVPEPGSLALLLVGALALVPRRRRRRA